MSEVVRRPANERMEQTRSAMVTAAAALAAHPRCSADLTNDGRAFS